MRRSRLVGDKSASKIGNTAAQSRRRVSRCPSPTIRIQYDTAGRRGGADAETLQSRPNRPVVWATARTWLDWPTDRRTDGQTEWPYDWLTDWLLYLSVQRLFVRFFARSFVHATAAVRWVKIKVRNKKTETAALEVAPRGKRRNPVSINYLSHKKIVKFSNDGQNNPDWAH